MINSKFLFVCKNSLRYLIMMSSRSHNRDTSLWAWELTIDIRAAKVSYLGLRFWALIMLWARLLSKPNPREDKRVEIMGFGFATYNEDPRVNSTSEETMKLMSFGSLSSIFQPILPLNRILNCGKISCAVATPFKPQIPLFLRPATCTATISDLQKWHLWARNLASSVGCTFSELDNGPDSTLLHRELNWLIEDVVENPSAISRNGDEVDDASILSLRAELDDLYSLWKQRIEQRRPFQYLVGCEHWRDLVLSVQEGVLIPRPETELIVDLVNDVIKENKELGDGLWADLGTGSGALAIAIARILGSSGRVIATDLSPIAVGVASYNIQRNTLQVFLVLPYYFDSYAFVCAILEEK